MIINLCQPASYKNGDDELAIVCSFNSWEDLADYLAASASDIAKYEVEAVSDDESEIIYMFNPVENLTRDFPEIFIHSNFDYF